jgi:hypothetical protein
MAWGAARGTERSQSDAKVTRILHRSHSVPAESTQRFMHRVRHVSCINVCVDSSGTVGDLSLSVLQ